MALFELFCSFDGVPTNRWPVSVPINIEPSIGDKDNVEPGDVKKLQLVSTNSKVSSMQTEVGASELDRGWIE